VGACVTKCCESVRFAPSNIVEMSSSDAWLNEYTRSLQFHGFGIPIVSWAASCRTTQIDIAGIPEKS
jgi:hypothetical protein